MEKYEVKDYKSEIVGIFLTKDDDLTKTDKLNQLINDKVHNAVRHALLDFSAKTIKKEEPIIRELEELIIKLRVNVAMNVS